MSAPIEVPMSPAQRELFDRLNTNVLIAQGRLDLFVDTLFRGLGVTNAQNIQLVDGKLVGVIPDEKKDS